MSRFTGTGTEHGAFKTQEAATFHRKVVERKVPEKGTKKASDAPMRKTGDAKCPM